MASWVKIVNTLPRSRSIYALMRELRCKRQAALGLAVDWLCWLDVNSTNGETGMLDDEISDVLGWQGAAEALSAIGWVSHDEQGYVVAVDFKKHNGESAKKRDESALRMAKTRARRNACCAKGATNVAEKTQPDKIREEKSNTEFEHSSHSSLPCTEEARAGETPAQADGVGSVGERKAPRPANAGEVEAYLATITALKLTPPERQKAAMAFYDEMEAVGWVNRYGKNVWDWEAYARRWAMSWAENAHTPFRNGRPAESYSRNDRTSNGKGVNNYDIR